MAESSTFHFRNDRDEDQTIDKRDLVAALPSPDGASSVIVYVEHSKEDQAAPPKIKVIKGQSASTSPWAGSSDVETHIIISTKSGTEKAPDFYEDAVKPALATLFPKGHENFLLHHTTSTESILDLTHDVFFPTANAGLSLRIILLSGDGGVIDLVNGLLASPASSQYKPPQVVLLPLGTGNALYHSVTAGNDNTWGLNALAGDIGHSLPIFTARFSPGARLLVDEARKEEELPMDDQTQYPSLHGAVVCSWGFHASLVGDSDTAEYRKFGIERFQMAAKALLHPDDGSPPHPYKAKVSVLRGDDWAPLEEEEHMYVLATTVSNLEKTFKISPATKPLDGSLRLVRFGPTDGDGVMKIMTLAYQNGKHVEDPAVLYDEIDGLRIEFQGKEKDAKWRRICVDGKIIRVEEDGWVELRKQPRRVLDVVLG